ncbi:unnamed protein product [Caenorhabditis bovis]|uniref:Amine oxidase domain-containing protein n=1 Tax=Caenorhabditis bovis TaxID=2654633 RepID=A0A8S1F8S4_9PELO|nr:unnamed protein product [Caenorhabditis bovis]
MKIVCIGAAPTALGAAYRLNELQSEGNEAAMNTEILLIEQENHAGGLSCTVTDDKGFLWDMGGHITFNHNFPYYEKATKWAVDEWNKLARNCMVDMNYVFDKKGIHLVPYPAQFAVPLFPEPVKNACLVDLKERYERDHTTTAPENFEEWVLQHFGPTILNTFFKPYTKKVWTVEPLKMSPNWVGTRVAKLPQEKLEELCAMDQNELANADFGWGPNSYFTFPKYGGTGNVWNSMAKKLPNNWFKFNSKVVGVDAKEKTIEVIEKDQETPKKVEYDVLLNTAPIDQLIKSTQVTGPLDIKYNKVFIVGVGLRKPMTPFLENYTWLYFPDRNVPFFRVTILCRYGEVTPDSDKYWSVMCECARPIDDTVTEEEIVKQTLDGLVLKDMITREAIESVYSVTLPYGYPIPTPKRDQELARAHTELEKNQIYSRGRFGGWKYEVSNQDHCFMQGKEFIDRVVLGEPEKVYKTGVATIPRG